MVFVDAIGPGLDVRIVRFWQRLGLLRSVLNDKTLRLGIWVLAVEGW